MPVIQKPLEGEYAPYAIAYISLVPDDGLVLEHLRTAMQTTKELISAQSPELLVSRCAPGEWTIKEILVHVMDTERVMAYRAMCIARHDSADFPGFDQNEYVANADANERTIESILEEYAAVRTATLCLFHSFSNAALLRAGRANANPLTVRAAAYFIAGHELHHLQSIKENYL